MAAIDKTYVKTWEDYKAIRDWARKTDMIYPNGINGGKMIEWFYYPNLTESDFNGKEYPLWNTGVPVDMFLYKHCPFELVQNRLVEQYGPEIYGLDTEPENKHEIGNHFRVPKGITRDTYMISVTRAGEYWSYSDDYNIWTEDLEFGPWNTNRCYRRNLSRKALCRLIRKWNLPKEAKVHLSGNRGEFTIKIKK